MEAGSGGTGMGMLLYVYIIVEVVFLCVQLREYGMIYRGPGFLAVV